MEEFIRDVKKLAKKRGNPLVVFDPEFEDRPATFRDQHEKERVRDDLYRAMVAGRVYDHLFRKIRVADVCYLFNKDGYLGVNTSGELFAAAVLGKTVYAYDSRTRMGSYPHDLYEEPSTRQLIHEIVPTPEALLDRLG